MTARTSLRIGSRGSALALVQALLVREALTATGHAAEVRVIVTEGDVRAPDTAWGEGAFVGAIERALLDGEVDVAVHSAKDVPTDEDPRLRIAAYLPRADARDAIVLPQPGPASLEDVPRGARVGTDSPRRAAFVRAMRPDVVVRPLHGNVDTRLRRLDDCEADALVLAVAGLERLGRADRASIPLDPSVVPPAPGQGALAVQVRRDDAAVSRAVAALDDVDTRRAVDVERAILAGAGGGCRAPLGAFARITDDTLRVTAGFARPDGDVVARATAEGAVRDRAAVVEAVLAELAMTAAAMAAHGGRPEVIVARPARQGAGLLLSLVDSGLAPRSVPTTEIELCPAGALDEAVVRLDSYRWVVLTSANAVRALDAAARRAGVDLADLGPAGPRWAVVGRATARELALIGVPDDLRPDTGDESAAGIARLLTAEPGAAVLLPRSSLASPDLPDELRRHGAEVEDITAYETIVAPPGSRRTLEAALAADPRAVVAASPSAVRGLVTLAEAIGAIPSVRSLPIVVPGSTTADAARAEGFEVVRVAASPGVADLAAAVAAAAAVQEGTL